MKTISDSLAIYLITAVALLALAPRASAQTQQAQPIQPGQRDFLRDYSQDPEWFPSVLNPYASQPIPAMNLQNSPRLRDLIVNERLELSLADALSLALENNLDIAVERYLKPMAEVDVLRAKSGQAARGVPGASVPGGLSAGAIGAGVTGEGGGGGTGSAGGITGGGGAVSIGQVGAFDPTASFNFSWDRVSSPLNTTVVSGTPTSTSNATAYSGSYAQLFPTGTSYFVALSGLRQSTTENRLFNPAVSTRFTFGFNQPILNGVGKVSNLRFLMVARNNRRIADEVFRLQVANTIVAVENLYWDLVASVEKVGVAERSLDVAQTLLDNNRRQAEIGTLAPLDVVAAEAEVAARRRDLIVAQTGLQLIETLLKNLLSKTPDAGLDAARILATDRLPEPRDADIPDLSQAISTALQNRPDLRQAEGNLQNQDISVSFTNQSLRPAASIFGLLAGAGLSGNTSLTESGVGGSLDQTFGYDFPEYAGGISLSLPLRNRAAQADHLRAQLENNQMQVGVQRFRNQVSLEVRQGVINILQGKAQVEAAHESVRLAQETLEAEQRKLSVGVSTPYEVILRDRDYVAARQVEVEMVSGYARALVELDRAMGTTLARNGIEISDALTGTVSSRPTPPVSIVGFSTESTEDPSGVRQ